MPPQQLEVLLDLVGVALQLGAHPRVLNGTQVEAAM
jgi:hypothetical protein